MILAYYDNEDFLMINRTLGELEQSFIHLRKYKFDFEISLDHFIWDNTSYLHSISLKRLDSLQSPIDENCWYRLKHQCFEKGKSYSYEEFLITWNYEVKNNESLEEFVVDQLDFNSRFVFNFIVSIDLFSAQLRSYFFNKYSVYPYRKISNKVLLGHVPFYHHYKISKDVISDKVWDKILAKFPHLFPDRDNLSIDSLDKYYAYNSIELSNPKSINDISSYYSESFNIVPISRAIEYDKTYSLYWNIPTELFDNLYEECESLGRGYIILELAKFNPLYHFKYYSENEIGFYLIKDFYYPENERERDSSSDESEGFYFRPNIEDWWLLQTSQKELFCIFSQFYMKGKTSYDVTNKDIGSYSGDYLSNHPNIITNISSKNINKEIISRYSYPIIKILNYKLKNDQQMDENGFRKEINTYEPYISVNLLSISNSNEFLEWELLHKKKFTTED